MLIPQLFEEIGGESGTMTISVLKSAVTGEKNALNYDWVRARDGTH